MAKQQKLKPFGIADKLGYMFGDFGNDFTFILSTMILTKFYTDVMVVDAAVVGFIMMLSRFVDAVTDVTMGRICDAAKPTAAGKFKPWLLRMCIPVAFSSFVMYAPGFISASASEWSDGVKIAYLGISYILWGSFCYTGINIPYGSMVSAISSDPNDCAGLSTFRTLGGTLAGVVIGMSVPMLAYDSVVNEKGEQLSILNGTKVAWIALGCSVLAVVCYLLAYKMITERVKYKTTKKQEKTSIVKMLKNAAKNRALISIIVASILMLLAQLTMQNMGSYIYPDYYGSNMGQVLSTVAMTVSMIIAAVVAKPLAAKFGKAEVSIVSCFFATGVCVLTWLIRPQQMWLFIVLQSLNWLGLGMFSMVCWALITDVIDYSEIKNGVREDGSVYALYSFARKLGQAVAAGLSGWLLSAIGYNGEAAKLKIPQTDAVKEGMFDITTLVPAIGFLLLALVLWFWYPLHKKQVDANVETLKAKHSK